MELRLYHGATPFTPNTCLVYRTLDEDPKVVDAFVRISGIEKPTVTDTNLAELIFRYRQKQVDRAVLLMRDTAYEDSKGDGFFDIRSGEAAFHRGSMWQLIGQMAEAQSEVARVFQPERLYELVPSLTAERAMERVFVATCGSTAAVLHELRSHSVLWASIPPAAKPNEVHRHLGGNVYCLFFQGTGRFHRVDPRSGFETVPIDITKSNSFQMITIPNHLWYQPINTGDIDLQYLMIHEPAFDRSELLVLDKSECRMDWNFEF